MFREMRRNKQLLAPAEAIAVLQRGSSGVLAVLGDDDYPYAVPLSYVYSQNKLFFHCARQGHKLEAIAKYDKASFCVIDTDRVVPHEYTTYFRSVIAFGKAGILRDQTEKRDALRLFAAKYAPDYEQEWSGVIEQQLDRLHVVELAIERLTGKEAVELVEARTKPI
ncbi:MAG: pyridoxamine 5'-phosphate oxidase family protein [Deltaproteobacteria bacterium]|jgi:nitroimidazol reductase NimA-like FMN-containing flavoprotein (pyridoxamine 5'-phosphate oxidase superfamily)|nr:pyridoxamine 5'-phosphate oxidase family protein [Deltaproteobacteria bacterium]